MIAWNQEMQRVHHRVERALREARTSASTSNRSDLLTYCHGFCAALTSHHTSEDAVLFGRLLHDHPELAPAVDRLVADHQVLAGLIAEFEDCLSSEPLDSDDHRERIQSRLDGIQVRMSAHFAYEEEVLDRALDHLVAPVQQSRTLLGDL